jgi:large subunit ribosomal protein L15
MIATSKNIETIDLDVLIENGLASRNTLVKILGRGTVDAKVTVKAHAFSKSAKEAIEAKGGSTETIS